MLTALMLRVELRSQRPSLPRAAYVLGVSAMVLFGFLARDPFLFIVLWSVQHWSAAMGLASLVASGGAQSTATHWHRLLAPINRRGWAVLLVLAVVSTLLLLRVLEVEAVTDEYAYADRIFGADAALWLRSSPLRARCCWHWASRADSFTTCSIALPSVFVARCEEGSTRSAEVRSISPASRRSTNRGSVISVGGNSTRLDRVAVESASWDYGGPHPAPPTGQRDERTPCPRQFADAAAPRSR
jgi:hypothetical protein